MRGAGGVWLVSRWLVSNVPSWLLLLGLVVVVAGGALLLLFFVRRRFPQLEEGTHNDVTVFAFGFVGFMFAILVTFVSNSLWGQINDADAKARTEGAIGLQLAGVAGSGVAVAGVAGSGRAGAGTLVASP